MCVGFDRAEAEYNKHYDPYEEEEVCQLCLQELDNDSGVCSKCTDDAEDLDEEYEEI